MRAARPAARWMWRWWDGKPDENRGNPLPAVPVFRLSGGAGHGGAEPDAPSGTRHPVDHAL